MEPAYAVDAFLKLGFGANHNCPKLSGIFCKVNYKRVSDQLGELVVSRLFVLAFCG